MHEPFHLALDLGEFTDQHKPIRTWKRFAESGATTAVQASEDVVPASQLRDAYARIRELQCALGRKTMENEILRAAQEVVKKTPSLRRNE